MSTYEKKGFFRHKDENGEIHILLPDVEPSQIQATADDEGKVLGVKNGAVGWVENEGSGGVTSWNDLEDKPFGETTEKTILVAETNVTTMDMEGMFAAPFDASAILNMFMTGGDPSMTINATVNFDGVDYDCVFAFDESVGGIVAGNKLAFGDSDSGEPFAILIGEETALIAVMADTTPTEHTLSIASINTTIQKIDPKYLPDVENSEGSGSSTSSDWSVNDETAAGYIKNRTHYAVEQDTSSMTTVAFDPTDENWKEKYEYVEVWDTETGTLRGYYVKVSDDIVDLNQFSAGGANFTYMDDGNEYTVNSISYGTYRNGYAIDAYRILLINNYTVVKKGEEIYDNCHFITSENDGFTLTKGVWFAYDLEYPAMYCNSLTYYSSPELVKKLDDKYVPWSIPRYSDVYVKDEIKNMFERIEILGGSERVVSFTSELNETDGIWKSPFWTDSSVNFLPKNDMDYIVVWDDVDYTCTPYYEDGAGGDIKICFGGNNNEPFKAIILYAAESPTTSYNIWVNCLSDTEATNHTIKILSKEYRLRYDLHSPKVANDFDVNVTIQYCIERINELENRIAELEGSRPAAAEGVSF